MGLCIFRPYGSVRSSNEKTRCPRRSNPKDDAIQSGGICRLLSRAYFIKSPSYRNRNILIKMTEIKTFPYSLSYHFFEKHCRSKYWLFDLRRLENDPNGSFSCKILLGFMIAHAMCLQKLGHSTINAL